MAVIGILVIIADIIVKIIDNLFESYKSVFDVIIWHIWVVDVVLVSLED